MRQVAKLCLFVFAVVIPLTLAWMSSLPAAPDQVAEGEDEIHRAPAAREAGKPATIDATAGGQLKLTVLDAATKQPTFCRVNVVGSDDNYYEPRENLLAPNSLHKLGNRSGKGPFRYYGWFFYCDGTGVIDVPAGVVRIEVWKGFEYRPVTLKVESVVGKTVEAVATLERAADMAAKGWYSGDTHIHMDRRNDTEDARALDLAAAEDIRFAHILCMNDPRTYEPLMEKQIHHQLHGMGQKSERRRGIYQIASGQEYRAVTYGHICLIGGSRLVDADGLKTDPNNWPPFGIVADELHGIGGFAFHAHGGYGKEIYADFAQRATDGVELLQFAEYRDIALEGWYHILNAGYRFPAVGACDYPYCRALGDCRTYVHLTGESSFDAWNHAAAAGRSFFTTGPLVELTVNGKIPGDTVELPAGNHELNVAVNLQSLVASVNEVQLIIGGKIVSRRAVTAAEQGASIVWQTKLPATTSTWVAVRAFAQSPTGRENSEAHTNPVYVTVGDKPICEQESVVWLLKKLDERIAANAARKFDEKEKLLTYLQKSRQTLAALLTPNP